MLIFMISEMCFQWKLYILMKSNHILCWTFLKISRIYGMESWVFVKWECTRNREPQPEPQQNWPKSVTYFLIWNLKKETGTIYIPYVNFYEICENNLQQNVIESWRKVFLVEFDVTSVRLCQCSQFRWVTTKYFILHENRTHVNCFQWDIIIIIIIIIVIICLYI
jgi:hypothetical protein